jgi:hypothetical protein
MVSGDELVEVESSDSKISPSVDSTGELIVDSWDRSSFIQNGFGQIDRCNLGSRLLDEDKMMRRRRF